MADWYCKIAGKLYGPFDNARLRQMAAEERLHPDDLLREGQDGDWFPAEEIENLFPEARPAARSGRDDRDDADDWVERDDGDDLDDRPRRRRKRGAKTLNYYQVLMRNLQEPGSWTQYIGWTAVFEGLMRGVTASIMMLRAGALDPVAFIVWTLVGAVMVLVYCLVDALLFGVACVALGVRLDPRRHHVLDLFGYAYVVGLALMLFRLLTACAHTMAADFWLLVIPIAHGVVFGYLLQHYWDLPAGKAYALTAIRFVYQMLVVGAWLCFRYLA
ncbi:MAG: DUF4339 domain-containing protein [Gemmataceae bacterium]|nr:DUF4339 domain-containing protein [Gemmataceae bacterium]